MTLKPYAEMKESGVEWLGAIPIRWLHTRVGRLCSKIGSGKTPSGGAEVYVTEGVILIRSQNVYDEGLFLQDVVCITNAMDDEMSSTRVLPGDVLLNITGASLGRTCLVPNDIEVANVNQHVCILRLKDPAFRSFLSYALKSNALRGQIDAAQNGAARDGLNFDQIAKLVVVVPPPEEMALITAYLDRETARIDTLVAEQERLMDLLAEKRRAVISHAVTKGLDPSAPMKQSGIDWLGEVPAHWRITRLGLAADLIQTGPFGSQLHSDDYIEDGIPLINPSNIVDGTIVPAPTATVDNLTADRLSEHRLMSDDIVFGRRGEMGRCALVLDHQAGWLCGTGSLKVRLSGSSLPAFVVIYLRSDFIREWLTLMSVGSTMDNLNADILGRIPIPAFSLQEQQAIVAHLDRETAKLDTLTAEAERGIALLKERRAALISAAVTGKVDVRGLVDAEEVAA